MARAAPVAVWSAPSACTAASSAWYGAPRSTAARSASAATVNRAARSSALGVRCAASVESDFIVLSSAAIRLLSASMSLCSTPVWAAFFIASASRRGRRGFGLRERALRRRGDLIQAAIESGERVAERLGLGFRCRHAGGERLVGVAALAAPAGFYRAGTRSRPRKRPLRPARRGLPPSAAGEPRPPSRIRP